MVNCVIVTTDKFVAYLEVANFTRLGITVLCYVPVFSQAPILVLSYRWSSNLSTYYRMSPPPASPTYVVKILKNTYMKEFIFS